LQECSLSAHPVYLVTLIIFTAMKSLAEVIFVRRRHVCPWYFCWSFDNVFRRWLQNPNQILSGIIAQGDTVIDIGPGRGYFTIPIAHLVGNTGKVIAVDIQEKMLEFVKRNAVRADVAERITCTLVYSAELGLDIEADFVLAFWMVHEVPDKVLFLKNIFNILKAGKKLLIAEPYLHVSKAMMINTIQTAIDIGFLATDTPKYFFSRAVILQKPASINATT